MKKLMIAAAAAAISSGAFALCGEQEPVTAIIVKPAKVQRLVYKFTFTGKTTKGDEVVGAKNSCGEGGGECIARIPAKLKIKGWMALCDNDCHRINQGSAGAAAYAFWVLKPYKGWFVTPDNDAAEEFALDFAEGEFPHVIGKKPNKAEAFGTLKGTIYFAEEAQWVWPAADGKGGVYFAGLGKYKAPIYKKIKGNFAGSPAGSWYVSKEICKQTHVYDCETLKLIDCDQDDGPATVVFGKWQMKYSKSASKKFAAGKYPKTPGWASAAQYVAPEE